MKDITILVLVISALGMSIMWDLSSISDHLREINDTLKKLKGGE